MEIILIRGLKFQESLNLTLAEDGLGENEKSWQCMGICLLFNDSNLWITPYNIFGF